MSILCVIQCHQFNGRDVGVGDPLIDQKGKLLGELRRGVLVLAVLSALREERHAYLLRKELAASGLSVEEGTLYPLLRRIEEQGLLCSRWDDADGRARRYYRLSADGAAMLEYLNVEWLELEAAVNSLIGV
ncbi:PadR family transcriptional regulator [Xanthomonas sp. CFBP 8700]|nr:PadR family transcriptional regulator [Xanthomonas bonasiae]